MGYSISKRTEMNSKYTIPSSEFFYINGIEVNLIEKGWQAIVSGKNKLLCLDNLSNADKEYPEEIEITIGQRHENGDGLHCLITVDNLKELVSFESDIAGGVPIFWTSLNGIIIVASKLELLIALTKNIELKLNPNLKAFSELLIAGYIYTEMQTGIEDVQLLPPKTKLLINDSGKIEIQKTAPEFSYSEDVLVWDEAKKLFKEELVEGAERLDGKKVACLLSGGADSRIAAISAVTSGIPVDFYTFGQSTVNVSDFYVASHIGYKLGKKVNCFSTSATSFLINWKQACSHANWINDSVWWAGRIPQEMFSELRKYDVIIRGDGDGIYGWKTAVANVSDILHRLEISELSSVKRHSRYFYDPEDVFGLAETSRKALVEKYEGGKISLRDLKNILYQKIREPRGIAPGIWHFSRLTAVDAPLLWEKSLHVASRIPKNKRYDKQIIFDVLKTYDEIKDVPFSQGGSWDNQLEFYYSGVWEELTDYIKIHSPFPVKHDELRKNYIKPSVIDIKVKSPFNEASNKIKKQILGSDLGRKTAFKYFSHLTHPCIEERLIMQLAMISNLCELMSMEKETNIVSTRIR